MKVTIAFTNSTETGSSCMNKPFPRSVFQWKAQGSLNRPIGKLPEDLKRTRLHGPAAYAKGFMGIRSGNGFDFLGPLLLGLSLNISQNRIKREAKP